MKNDHCFATLAVGRRYRFYARQLLNDLEFFAPQKRVVVLTDRPAEFQSHKNAHVRHFRPEGVLRYYHDKRFLLRHSLPIAKTCILIDSNTRILQPINPHLDFLEGISGITTQRLDEHFVSLEKEEQIVARRRFISLAKSKSVVSQAAEQLGLHLSDITFVFEFLYAATGPPEIMEAFLAQWDRLAKYMDYHGLAWSEGYGIGLAAAKVGLPIRQHSFLNPSSFYKQRREEYSTEREAEMLGINKRIVICHRDYHLLRQYARFSPWPAGLEQRLQRLLIGARWLWFRFTGTRFRRLESAK